MQARIPANYRLRFRWVGDLDAPSLMSLCMGGAVAFESLKGAAPIPLKVPEVILAAGIGLLLAFGKWPLERGGDRLWTWAMRAFDYYRRPRRGSMFSWRPR